MILVGTFLARSSISGMGLFAAAPIPDGTLIWEFTEGQDFEAVPDELNNPLVVGMDVREGRAFVMHYGYKDKETGNYIVCVDNARFFNHSTHPNTDNTGEVTIASRDIQKGEELTCNYFEFDADAEAKLGRHPKVNSPCLPPKT